MTKYGKDKHKKPLVSEAAPYVSKWEKDALPLEGAPLPVPVTPAAPVITYAKPEPPCHKGNILVWVVPETDKHKEIALYGGGYSRGAEYQGDFVILDLGAHVDPPIILFGVTLPRLERWNFRIIRLDWRDFDDFDFNRTDWKQLVASFEDMAKDEPIKILASCTGGHGRTGSALAILGELWGMVPKGKDPILELRKLYCDKAVESSEQIAYVGKILKYKSKAKSKWETGGYQTSYGNGKSGTVDDGRWEDMGDVPPLPHKSADPTDHTWRRLPAEKDMVETVDATGIVRRAFKGVLTATLIPVAVDTTGERIYGCVSCGAERYNNQLSIDGWCPECDKYFIEGIIPDGKHLCNLCSIPFAKEDLVGGLCSDCRGGAIGS